MKYLIFDFDGTLFESSLGIFNSFHYSCNCLGLKSPDINFFKQLIGPPVGSICDSVFPDLSTEKRSAFISYFRSHYDSIGYLQSYPFSGITNLLRSIDLSPNYFKPYIVTNKPTSPTRLLLDQYNYTNYFEYIIGIDYPLYCNKNFPYASKTEAILFVKSLLDNNRDVLYIGDTPSDMKCSYQAGIDFLAVGYGYYDWAIDHRPHLFVNSVADLYLQLHLD